MLVDNVHSSPTDTSNVFLITIQVAKCGQLCYRLHIERTEIWERQHTSSTCSEDAKLDLLDGCYSDPGVLDGGPPLSQTKEG